MKKLLNTLYITDDSVYMSLDGDNVVCLKDKKEVFRIPLANIENICCFGYLGCSPTLMGRCASESIALNFFSPYGKFLARIVGPIKGNVFLRKLQIEVFSDNSVILKLVRNNIAGKLNNTVYVLKRALRDYPEIDEDMSISNCIGNLSDSMSEIYSVDDVDILRGIEGNCAKKYFHIFDRMIRMQKEDFFLVERNKRPPLDRVNALLSFLYTLYTCDYAAALESVGLDPYIGFFHTIRPGRCSLACDLVEESRGIIERFVLTLINLKMLKADDFDVQESGAVFLNEQGRKKVLREWQEKKRTEIHHPIIKEKIKLGLLPFVQANLLAKFIRGEIPEYPPFIWR